MKEQVSRAALAAGLVILALAFADKLLEGSKCREWAQCPALAAPQWIVGYANAWAEARQTCKKVYVVDQIQDVWDTDIFEARV